MLTFRYVGSSLVSPMRMTLPSCVIGGARLDFAYPLGRVEPVARRPGADLSYDLNAIAASGSNLDAARATPNAEVDRTVYREGALERTARAFRLRDDMGDVAARKRHETNR